MCGRDSFSERSKYIPVRLTSDERRYLRLVESVISVTDYTGKVDADFASASKRSHLILKQVGCLDVQPFPDENAINSLSNSSNGTLSRPFVSFKVRLAGSHSSLHDSSGCEALLRASVETSYGTPKD